MWRSSQGFGINFKDLSGSFGLGLQDSKLHGLQKKKSPLIKNVPSIINFAKLLSIFSSNPDITFDLPVSLECRATQTSRLQWSGSSQGAYLDLILYFSYELLILIFRNCSDFELQGAPFKDAHTTILERKEKTSRLRTYHQEWKTWWNSWDRWTSKLKIKKNNFPRRQKKMKSFKTPKSLTLYI